MLISFALSKPKNLAFKKKILRATMVDHRLFECVRNFLVVLAE
jgi:hypothetical protein